MIRKKPAPHLMRGVKRFSDRIMPNRGVDNLWSGLWKNTPA
jgi:hypothetical protein